MILFLKKIKTIVTTFFKKNANALKKRKKEIRHITDGLEINYDDYDQEYIKTKYQDSIFLKGAILIMSF